MFRISFSLAQRIASLCIVTLGLGVFSRESDTCFPNSTMDNTVFTQKITLTVEMRGDTM